MPSQPFASLHPWSGSAETSALGFTLNPSPVPECVPMQPAALDEFARILRMGSRNPTPPDWWVKVAHHEWGGRCAFCGRLLLIDAGLGRCEEQPTVAALVPVSIGGPHLHDAVVLSCSTCKAALGNRDWLAWGKAADRQTRKRLRVMRDRIGTAESFNHLARNPAECWTKLKVERLLTERWAQPRFCVQAALTTGGCFLGAKDRELPPAEFAAIAWAHHGQRADVPDTDPRQRQVVFNFQRPRECLAAVWDLIGVNAWVRRSDLRPVADFATPADDAALAEWVFVSPNVGDLVRRAYAKPTGFKRHSQEWRAGKVTKGKEGRWAVSG